MKIGERNFELGKETYIMGILNVTPDSFSDGGCYMNVKHAVGQARKMIEEGVDIIDIGGESTRPGHENVSVEEEIKRVVPIIKAIKKELDIPISIDTSKSQVAKAALEAGANLVNDVWGFKKDPAIAKVTADHGVPCCLMHNRENKNYSALMEDVKKDLEDSVRIALEAGVKKESIILDPGIGFAKSLEDNLTVMKHLDKLCKMGYPVLLGTSRKSMIGLALDLPVTERLEGTIATTVMGIQAGVSFVRVHDVKENKRAALMTDKIMSM